MNNKISETNDNRTPIRAADVGPMDVLLGRGTGINRHVGNRSFREQILEKRRDEFLTSSSRRRRYAIIDSIIEEVHSKGGRFLKRVQTKQDESSCSMDSEKVAYAVVSDSKLLEEKIKQAFRYSSGKEQKKPFRKSSPQHQTLSQDDDEVESPDEEQKEELSSAHHFRSTSNQQQESYASASSQPLPSHQLMPTTRAQNSLNPPYFSNSMNPEEHNSVLDRAFLERGAIPTGELQAHRQRGIQSFENGDSTAAMAGNTSALLEEIAASRLPTTGGAAFMPLLGDHRRDEPGRMLQNILTPDANLLTHGNSPLLAEMLSRVPPVTDSNLAATGVSPPNAGLSTVDPVLMTALLRLESERSALSLYQPDVVLQTLLAQPSPGISHLALNPFLPASSNIVDNNSLSNYFDATSRLWATGLGRAPRLTPSAASLSIGHQHVPMATGRSETVGSSIISQLLPLRGLTPESMPPYRDALTHHELLRLAELQEARAQDGRDIQGTNPRHGESTSDREEERKSEG